MIQIIEGVDGVGKTTLAVQIAESRSASLLHAGPPTERDWRAEYLLPLIARPPGDIVLDRWHMGEMVWPAVFDRPSLFEDVEEYRLCCWELSRLGAEVILVIRDEAGIRKTLTERGEEDQIDVVLEAQWVYQMTGLLTPYLPVQIVHSDVLHSARSPWTSPV